jgi:hypothetical protein
MFIVALLLISSIPLLAQDAEGGKDHPLLSRMPGFYISECSQNYTQLDFLNAAGENIKLEGNLTFIWYVFNSESANKEPSFSNYQKLF